MCVCVCGGSILKTSLKITRTDGEVSEQTSRHTDKHTRLTHMESDKRTRAHSHAHKHKRTIKKTAKCKLSFARPPLPSAPCCWLPGSLSVFWGGGGIVKNISVIVYFVFFSWPSNTGGRQEVPVLCLCDVSSGEFHRCYTVVRRRKQQGIQDGAKSFTGTELEPAGSECDFQEAGWSRYRENNSM